MADLHIELAHSSMKIGLHPQDRHTGGPDDQKNKREKAEPQPKQAHIIAPHKPAAGPQSLMSGAVRLIQEYIAGKTIRQ